MNWSNILEETTLQNLMETFCIFKRSIKNRNRSSRIKIQIITYVRNIFGQPTFDDFCQTASRINNKDTSYPVLPSKITDHAATYRCH
jgi:hypothetical protein